MAAEENTKIPAPLYAAAAVGDLAYRRLRKLPTRVTELRGRVAGGDLDMERLRSAARRNVATVVTGAQAAQERAQAIYTDLVAHGEEVVRNRRVVHATVGIPREGAPAPEGTSGPRGAADAKDETGRQDPTGPAGE